MFDVNVTNNYFSSIFLGMAKGNDKTEVKSGKSGSINGGGNRYIDIPLMGHVLIVDLAKEKLHGYEGDHYPSETWGALIRYRGLDFYYRYEGGGRLDVTVDKHGCLNVTEAKGSAMVVNLRDIRDLRNKDDEDNG